MLRIPRIIIAGTHSGVGKTTIATGIMAALVRRGLKVQAYKTGPDYIDPGYHTLATGRPARNLDAFLLPPEMLTQVFVRAAATADIAVIEGVMGLFDGGAGGISSTAGLAQHLQTPVILIVDIRAIADSAAAVVCGFAHFEPKLRVAGIILNRAGSDGHYRMVKEAIETRAGVPVFGCLRQNVKLALPERHLGLLPVEENGNADWPDELAEKIAGAVDLESIIRLAQTAEPLPSPPPGSAQNRRRRVRIGIARDEAFTFYYQDALETLEKMGAELVPFSPLRDKNLPPGVKGLIFGGGFPEIFGQPLAANKAIQDCIRQGHAAGMPIYAECGGMIYLCREIGDFDGNVYALTGLVPAVCRMQKKLARVGYIEAEALRDNVLCVQNGKIRGHEFHYSTMIPDGGDFNWAFTFKRHRDGGTYPAGYCHGNLLASYLHCHFAGTPAAALRFVEKCAGYGERVHGDP